MTLSDFGLYIHTPFCSSKCLYCDFNSYVGLKAYFQDYVQALKSEIRRVPSSRSLKTVTSVYFGGGNPALLGETAIADIVNECDLNFKIYDQAEITIEMNPENARYKFLRFLKTTGFNRLSLGWQSLNDARLALLRRRHSKAEAIASLAAARQAGFDNINVDMIFGLPGQTVKDWQEEIKLVADRAPEHISAYSLSVEPQTPLKALVEAGEIKLAFEEDTAEMYLCARRDLTKAGYNHYEISNFAQPAKECRHNINYWRGGDYIGLGAGAHSHIEGKRWWCFKHPKRFIDGAAKGETTAGIERLDKTRRLGERIILGLRMNSGVNLSEMEEEFNMRPADIFGDVMRELHGQGLLNISDTISLTEKGLLLANEVMVGFVVA